MNFSVVCIVGLVATLLFGLAFFIAPEATAALYGISGWSPGTLLVARLFGIAFLYLAGALYAVQHTADALLQKRIANAFALGSLVATVVSVQAVLGGAINALGWSTVLIYAFFTLAWGSIAIRKTV